jgi:hypothetical protein
MTLLCHFDERKRREIFIQKTRCFAEYYPAYAGLDMTKKLDYPIEMGNDKKNKKEKID